MSQAAPDTTILSPLQMYSFSSPMVVDGEISQDGTSTIAIALLPRYMMILCDVMLDQFVALLKSTQEAHAMELEIP
jgi:hypothetical protein